MPPVISEIDIRRAAALLLKHYGDDAAARATMRANALLAAVDREGHGVWLRISSALEEQLRARGVHDPLH